MKKPILIISILLLSLSTIAQMKNIRGSIVNSSTYEKVPGVSLNLLKGDTLDISNEKGNFHFVIDAHFTGFVVLNHPDFYPKLIRVKELDNYKPQKYFILSREILLDTIYPYEDKNNKRLIGEVYDKNASVLLAYAVIELPNGKRISYSDKEGKIITGIPKKSEFIKISHPDFEPTFIKLKTRKKRESFKVNLKREVFMEEDTLWTKYNYQFALAFNELVIGSLGIHAQRFVAKKHAVGIQLSYFYKGTGATLFSGRSEFNGIKLAPYYRYYFERTKNRRLFVETKLIGGYFDFYDLFYSLPPDNKDGRHYSVITTNYGIGGDFGLSFNIANSKHFIFSMLFGVQFYPMNVPLTQEDDHYKYEVENNWWYIYGPGSVFTIKLLVGTIF